ncbi:GNAT family N-acetyltransferase [Velocimicrobium porci]|uniref:GNAT family N-acetyltransferase n=1 Tax=Velocimicrobium porci TaxID=2606634 RepID=A0A6L5XXJ6_9FIRM|nr:GNAT family N-acetyltransferase [Velocimicrobium porci]MSS63590.1 GNAT family N-acetyltransferase [Velocimicrobium porci]
MEYYKVDKTNEEQQKQMYQLYMQAVNEKDMLHELLDFSEFKEKLFWEQEGLEKITFLESRGKAFATGCMDKKNQKAFVTMVVVEKEERRKGIGRAILQNLEEVIFKQSGFEVIELSFFNPITFSWRIPNGKANHPNTPGVDMDSIAYSFFLACGYKNFAIQNVYYLPLENYSYSDMLLRKKESLEKEGITFEVYDDRIHKNMKEVIEGFGNPMWNRDILSEPPIYEKGRPILVPVYKGEVCGFTGALDVEASGRGYFAGIGIDKKYRQKGMGKVLFAFLCESLKKQNAKFMTLFTGENNPARHIYEEAGFKVVRTFADMRKSK